MLLHLTIAPISLFCPFLMAIKRCPLMSMYTIKTTRNITYRTSKHSTEVPLYSCLRMTSIDTYGWFETVNPALHKVMHFSTYN